MQKFRPIMLVVAVLVCALAIAQEYGVSLLENGAFDTDTTSWTGSGSGMWTDEAGHAAKGCVRFDGPGSLQTDLIPVEGRFLKISAWMKTQDVVRGEQPWHKATFQVSYYDADKKNLGHFDPGSALGTTDWTKYESVAYWEPHKGVEYVRLHIMNWNCQGTSWFDDVELVTAPPTDAYVVAPPRVDVENQPPRIWPQPELGAEVASLETDELSIGLHETITVSRTDGKGVSLTGISFDTGTEAASVAAPRMQIDRGFVKRVAMVNDPDAAPEPGTTESYIEVFRGSPIAYLFMRQWMETDETERNLNARLAADTAGLELWGFDGNRLVQAGPDGIKLDMSTTKPFVILRSADDTRGIIVYHPIPAEVRRWYVEDYVVETEPAIRVTYSGNQLRYTSEPYSAENGGYIHSLDFYFAMMPYEGHLSEALAEFSVAGYDLMQNTAPLEAGADRGYWTRDMGLSDGQRLLRMARYFPREFSSWMSSDGWDYGHDGGKGWGCMTASMKGVRVNPIAENALARDHALRMLTFFVEYAGPQGAPWNIYTWRGEAGRVGSLELHHQSVFHQYWEWRLGEYTTLFEKSDLVSREEKVALFNDLDRARYVYDPASPGTWTRVQPNGGYWFNYMDQPADRATEYVINTHTTSIGNVAHMAQLARVLGLTEPEAYWTEMFRKGIDGLLYAMNERWMWTSWDENEVLYGGKREGPRSYHQYMVSAWMPEVLRSNVELGIEYRLDELLAMEERMMQAKYTQENAKTLDLGQATLDWVEENRKK